MKKKEFIFIGIILLAALLLWAVMSFTRRDTCTDIEITVNGEVFGTYSLSEDQTIRIGDTNICEIKNGEAKMIEADCPDHLCMKQSSIGANGGTIVCLPNKVVITGTGVNAEKTGDFDAVV